MQKHATQLGLHLPEISWPFTENYWAGDETVPDMSDYRWWPWEQKAYWIDGSIRCALALQDPELMRAALAPLDSTIEHVNPDGYLGPQCARYARVQDPAYENFRWPHIIFFRALEAYAEATNDTRIPQLIRRHYLADEFRAPYSGTSRNVTNVESMLWAYERTGDAKLLEMGESAWSGFIRNSKPGDREAGDLHPDRVYANTPIKAHGVTYIEQAKIPAILFLHTGNPECLRYALAAQQRIFTHHMLIDGIPSATEDYRTTSALDAHETCDISDHTWAWGYLLMATGDGVWGDRIERACFNAGMGAIKKDWQGVQYFSCPNQVVATADSSHISLPGWVDSKGSMAYRPNPGHSVRCAPAGDACVWFSVSQPPPKAQPGGGLAATLYGASTVPGKVGHDRVPIEIEQQTHYPFEEDIRFRFKLEKSMCFPLALRIPQWCKSPRLAVNGRYIDMPVVSKGFARLYRTFNPGDRIALTLPMQTQISSWPGGGVGLEHGPLACALRAQEKWKSTVTPKYSTVAFLDWDATPATPWNYGIAAEEAQLLARARFERKPMTQDPWVDPPTSLVVPLRKIPGWDLKPDPEHPKRLRTPPLPEASTTAQATKPDIENIAFSPYGATHLRLTVFPKAV